MRVCCMLAIFLASSWAFWSGGHSLPGWLSEHVGRVAQGAPAATIALHCQIRHPLPIYHPDNHLVVGLSVIVADAKVVCFEVPPLFPRHIIRPTYHELVDLLPLVSAQLLDLRGIHMAGVARDEGNQCGWRGIRNGWSCRESIKWLHIIVSSQYS